MVHGILPALVTPMDDDGAVVDHATLGRLVEFQLQRGVHGFFVCGGSGEGLLLGADERRAVLETVLAASAGRGRIIAHIGALDTAGAQQLAVHAVRCGVAAVAAVPPVYYRGDDDALFGHYERIADAAAGTPVYVYNIPSATGVEISARTMARLITIPTVRGIKYSSYNLFDLHAIVELLPGELTALSGNDEVCLAALVMGAHGAIGSTYNVMPATFSALYRAWRAGQLAQAQALQFRANRVIQALLGVPVIAGLKVILSSWGYPCGAPRRPQRPLTADERRQLLAAVDAAGLAALEQDAMQQLAAR